MQNFGKHNSLNAELFQCKTFEKHNSLNAELFQCKASENITVWMQNCFNAKLWKQNSLNATLFQCNAVDTKQFESNTVSMQNCLNAKLLGQKNQSKTLWLPNALGAKNPEMENIFKVADCLPPGSWRQSVLGQNLCRASLCNLAAWASPLQFSGGRFSLFGLSVQKSLGLTWHLTGAAHSVLHATLHSFQDLLGVAMVWLQGSFDVCGVHSSTTLSAASST